ncbi:hypothetical protein CPB85DRAFT_1033948 [Mucidula mucida]|nr:hypothetical protein CPB85DRAFT_1033948 [Mucidula mucida]
MKAQLECGILPLLLFPPTRLIADFFLGSPICGPGDVDRIRNESSSLFLGFNVKRRLPFEGDMGGTGGAGESERSDSGWKTDMLGCCSRTVLSTSRLAEGCSTVSWVRLFIPGSCLSLFHIANRFSSSRKTMSAKVLRASGRTARLVLVDERKA